VSKFCVNCGKELKETQDLCLTCGAIVNKEKFGNDRKFNKFSVIGFALSLIAIFTFFIPFSFVLGVTALILSIIGLLKSVGSGSGKGFSISGIVVSVISLIVSVIFTFCIMLVIFVTIDEDVMTSKCIKRFGNGYNAVESYSINDDYYTDYWYCCVEDTFGEEASCIKFD